MYGTTLTHPMTNLARPAEQPRRRRRPSLLGALVLTLAWTMLAGTFLLDVARSPGGAAAAGQASACAEATAGT